MKKKFNVLSQTIWSDGESVCSIIKEKLTQKRALKEAYSLNIKAFNKYRDSGLIVRTYDGKQVDEIEIYYISAVEC